jgi:hypothetical protein
VAQNPKPLRQNRRRMKQTIRVIAPNWSGKCHSVPLPLEISFLGGKAPVDRYLERQRMPDAYSRVRAKAVDSLGGEEKADGWLRAPNRALGEATPLASLKTDEGVQAVLAVLVRLDYGVFS